jgi:hypothetical protein
MALQRSERRFLLGCLLPLAVAATVAKHLLNEGFDNFKGELEHRSLSIFEARSKGTLVRELTWDPGAVVVDGKPIAIQEAWIEERHLMTHRFVWFPHAERIGGVNLCVRVDPATAKDWTLVLPGGRRACECVEGRIVYFTPLEQWAGDALPLRVERTGAGSVERTVLTTLTLTPR